MYCERFSTIYHLMPFYDGDKSNVISVYGNSHYFQGYIAQGLAQYLQENISHYFFIADDLILNPAINESNYTEQFKLKKDTSFLPGFINLHDVVNWWSRIGEAYRYCPQKKGAETEKELPSYNEALGYFERFNLTLKPLNFNRIWQLWKSLDFSSFLRHDFILFFLYVLWKKQYNLRYPLVGAYSDISVVSSSIIKRFAHYCGVFAATDLFVELALPTALVLSARDIVTEKDLQLHGKAMWSIEDYEKILKYKNKLSLLLSDFPNDYLYLHPIKLSKWDTRI